MPSVGQEENRDNKYKITVSLPISFSFVILPWVPSLIYSVQANLHFLISTKFGWASRLRCLLSDYSVSRFLKFDVAPQVASHCVTLGLFLQNNLALSCYFEFVCLSLLITECDPVRVVIFFTHAVTITFNQLGF